MNYEDMGERPNLTIDTDVCERCAGFGYDPRDDDTPGYCDCPAGRRLMLRSGRGNLGYDVNPWGDR